MRAIIALIMLTPVLTGCLGGSGGALEPAAAGAPANVPGQLVAIDPNHDPLPLSPGDRAFWTVPGTAATSTFEYTLRVAPGADRLRVAFDRDVYHGADQLELHDPAGEIVDRVNGSWSLEVFAHDPIPGNWTAQLHAADPMDGLTRMRAKLEVEAASSTLGPGSDADPDPLLPNLRPVAPFGLRLWLGQLNTGEDRSYRFGSCHADEIVEDGALRCLRFDFGYGNTGDGPFEVLFTPVDDGMTEGVVQQRVHLSDGSTELRPAGTYEYHATHGHYHYDDILTAELYRVLDPETGEIEAIIEAAKRGACAHDWRIAHWDAFIAAPRFSHDSGEDCGVLPGQTSPTNARIGLSRGWTDLYGAGLQDNYVEASELDDGFFVLQVTIDAAGSVAETNETDNTGYTYFQVQGERVEVLERGLGNDPWDARKIVTEEWVP